MFAGGKVKPLPTVITSGTCPRATSAAARCEIGFTTQIRLDANEDAVFPVLQEPVQSGGVRKPRGGWPEYRPWWPTTCARFRPVFCAALGHGGACTIFDACSDDSMTAASGFFTAATSPTSRCF